MITYYITKFSHLDDWVENLTNYQDEINRTDLGTDFVLREFIVDQHLENSTDMQFQVHKFNAYKEFPYQKEEITRSNEPNNGRFTIRTRQIKHLYKTMFYVDQEDGYLTYIGKANGKWLLPMISKALYGNSDQLTPLNLDIEKITQDYADLWCGSVQDRNGNINSYQAFGSTIENDHVLGNDFLGCTKNSVGIIWDSDFGPEKIRIMKNGGFMITSSHWTNQVPQLLQNLFDDFVSQYCI